MAGTEREPAGDPTPSGAPRHRRREVAILLGLAFLIAVLVKSFLVQLFFIPSASMEPTLRPGDRIAVCRVCTAIGDVRRGQIIVFTGRDPERGVVGGLVHWLGQAIGVASPGDPDFVKRVVGLPGDVVELHAGELFVNGERVEEPYLHPDVDTSGYGPVTVPDGMLFVLGDHRTESGDSRYEPPRGVGLVSEGDVIGTVLGRVWPPSRVGAL